VLPGSRQTLAENARQILEAAGLPVVVAARGRERAEMLLPGCTAVEDGPGRGPAAALLGAHAAYPDCAFVALAVDMPLVPPELLRLLPEITGDWVVPAWSPGTLTRLPPGAGGRGPYLRLEPLCAVYRPKALEALARRVAAGRFDLQGLAGEEDVLVTHLGWDRIAPFGDPAAIFRNINEPRDLDEFAALPPRGSAETIPR
jgi:molybdopterin-guanine dinucleotide biosynthesis protein A